MSKFKPGQSGNPGGRPKGFAEVRELARHHTVAAIEKLVSIMTIRDQARASSRTSANPFGRPPGLPLWPGLNLLIPSSAPLFSGGFGRHIML